MKHSLAVLTHSNGALPHAWNKRGQIYEPVGCHGRDKSFLSFLIIAVNLRCQHHQRHEGGHRHVEYRVIRSRNAHAAVLRGKDFLHPVLRRNLLLLWRIALVFCQQVIAVMQGL